MACEPSSGAGAQVTFLMNACRCGSRTTFGVKLLTRMDPSSTAAATQDGNDWSDGPVQPRSRDDVGHRVVGGLARDRMPRVLAYLDQVIVSAPLGYHADLFD